MKKLLTLLVCIMATSQVYAQSRPSLKGTGGKDNSRAQAAQQSRSPSQTQSTTAASATATTTSSQVTSQVDNCKKDDVTKLLDTYCANNICTDATSIYSVLQGSGLPTSNSTCKAIIYEEIAQRVSLNYRMFKTECDAMNKNHVEAINEWAEKYAELEGDKQKAEKGKKTATAVAIGTSVAAVGSGIYNIVQNKEKKDLQKQSQKALELSNEEQMKKKAECDLKSPVPNGKWVYFQINGCKVECNKGYRPLGDNCIEDKDTSTANSPISQTPDTKPANSPSGQAPEVVVKDKK